MQNVPLHLAYLLTKHECVVIPGFGAFIVSPLQTGKTNSWGILYSPAKYLGFNPEVKHNDGLLANAIAKEKGITYNEAMHLIRQYVVDLHNSLNDNKVVRLTWIGNLCLTNERKIVFNSSRNLSCNAFNYGLTHIYLSPWRELQNSGERKSHPRKKDDKVIWIPLNRKILAYTGSVAAALLVFFHVPTPLNNLPENTPTQSAGIFSFASKDKVDESDMIENELVITSDALSVTDESTLVKPEAKKVSAISNRRYFIVIASLPDVEAAKKALTEFKANGFQDADVISSEEKHRIYITRFEDKAEAESFLIGFRKDNPKYSKAWLLGQNV